MRKLLGGIGLLAVSGLLASTLASPASAEPRPEEPKKDFHTSRIAHCEWQRPDGTTERFSSITVKFRIVDGKAFEIRGYAIKGKVPGSPVHFTVRQLKDPSGGSVDGELGSGILDEKGRAKKKLRAEVTGYYVSLAMATRMELLDPDTWDPDYCVTYMQIPYTSAS